MANTADTSAGDVNQANSGLGGTTGGSMNSTAVPGMGNGGLSSTLAEGSTGAAGGTTPAAQNGIPEEAGSPVPEHDVVIDAGGVSGDAGLADPGPLEITCPFDIENFGGLGAVVEFNNDGAWTWFTDERVIVDAEGGKILVSSDANQGGRNGNVDIVIYDIKEETVEPPTVLGTLNPDDHNNAAFLVKAPGNYLAFWAGHNQDCRSYFRNYSAGSWSEPGEHRWQGCEEGPDWARRVTYNNLWNMRSVGKIYNFVRSIEALPNLLTSNDDGLTWVHEGKLTSLPPGGADYAGYYKYWGNGIDRIDFVGTEGHPRDENNSVYHGYLRGEQIYDSQGNPKGTLSDPPSIDELTPVFRTGDSIPPVGEINRLWNTDLMRYEDGTVAVIWTARQGAYDPNSPGYEAADVDKANPTLQMFYSRLEDGTWQQTHLGAAGHKLYVSEEDYTGLGALHPDDKRLIFISTPVHPISGEVSTNGTEEIHKLYMGVTCDQGVSFEWVPLTEDAQEKQIRPVVPKWDNNNMALLWLQGTYRTAQDYDLRVVGNVVTEKEH